MAAGGAAKAQHNPPPHSNEMRNCIVNRAYRSEAVSTASLAHRRAVDGSASSCRVTTPPTTVRGHAQFASKINCRSRIRPRKGKSERRPGKGKGKSRSASPAKKSKKDQLCRHYLDHAWWGDCSKGKDCPFSHDKKRFDASGKLKAKPQGRAKSEGGGRGRQGAQSQGSGDGSGWTGQPTGVNPQGVMFQVNLQGSVREKSAYERQGVHPEVVQSVASQVAKYNGMSQSKGSFLKTLAELPKRCFVDEPHDYSGHQYWVYVGMGMMNQPVMLDTCSAVNSTTEELVVELLNFHESNGVELGDPKHPVIQLGKWNKPEQISGVASKKTVPLIGTVVIRVSLTRMGNEANSPTVDVRFKICAAGSTSWVGWILGGRALDAAERGGLGLQIRSDAYYFAGPNVLVARAEGEAEEKIDACYAIRRASVDDDPDEEAVTCRFRQGGQVQQGLFDREEYGNHAKLDSADPEAHLSAYGLPLIYDGEDMVLSEGEGAWVPVVPAAYRRNAKSERCSVQCVFPCTSTPLEAMPGIWDSSDDSDGMVLVVNQTGLDVALDRGTTVAEVHPTAIQSRFCQK